MRILAGILTLLLSLASPVRAEPWIAHAQTTVASGATVYNPATFTGGLVGEHSLPYTVPYGKVLRVKRITVECLWSAAIIPYMGDGTMDFFKSLDTFACGGMYMTPNANHLLPTMTWETDYAIPAGKQFNMRISTTWAPSNDWVYGWSISGELLDAHHH